MRSLIIGGIVFVIWSVFSVWLYVSKLKPAMQDQVTEQSLKEQQQAIPDTVAMADTLKQPEVIMPEDMVVNFAFDDSGFKPSQQSDAGAMEFKAWLKENAESIVSVTGHTDYIGSKAYNQALGLRRARTMQSYLIRQGIDADKISVTSKGEEEPIADNSTDEGRAKNRRAVISVNN